MDYYKNADKQCNSNGNGGLYNSVLTVVFSDEVTEEPVTTDQAKLWCKIELDYSEEDDVINALIKTARITCEQYVNLSLIKRTVTACINNANGNFYLPYGPVIGNPTGADNEGISIDVTFNNGLLKSPYGESAITYNAGYEELPENFKTALKQQILFLYENRGEGITEISPIAKTILTPLRYV